MIGRWLAAVLMLATPPAMAGNEPSDYREDEYRAPVPETLNGATVVSTQTAFELWQDGQVAFIDVMPRPPKPANLPEGTIWREKPRLSIPDAIWLPNVGYGRLADVMHAYFRAGLKKATAGNRDHPVLFFCLDDCWMSWNAAKRALEYGYEQVYWYPKGTDGWTFDDHPTEQLQPEPGDR
ncbi:PQQ-dependent catabolism-associated CXXCW motif protein [Notoacmeibacter sp. MSK16QG-6]|uniref:PQQ-dependent catabolism-associated CXXCW motif protein n=1 Tax=Notoacmeibacter sp. MSK16QG-6 TaxID=2957982 RepID=UPI00209C7328|nr:PQQ-dependent catabolism-associated CXXCW motif protein [Notoacmeibacter sp. MSK16QG-6]MCP1200650.1 PQQ-dependent catabolism-associated CXXCW motif protein [Notoacmeibacter sp. MSK16QG-6]